MCRVNWKANFKLSIYQIFFCKHIQAQEHKKKHKHKLRRKIKKIKKGIKAKSIDKASKLNYEVSHSLP